MTGFLLGLISGIIVGIIVEYATKLMWEKHKRKTLARGLVAELELFQKEIQEFKTHYEAPIYSNNKSKLHLFKAKTIQNLQTTYSDIIRPKADRGARTHSEVEELSIKTQKTIALLKEEMDCIFTI